MCGGSQHSWQRTHIELLRAEVENLRSQLSARDAEVERLKARDKEHAKQVDALHKHLADERALAETQTSRLAVCDAEVRALRGAVQTAYGYLWCVNNEPGTPHRYSPENAAYEVRKALRDLLTNEQRGAGINAAIAVLRATSLLTGEPGPGGEG